MPKVSKVKQILKDLNYIEDVHRPDEVENLLSIPKRDTRFNTPKTLCYKENAIHQADTLFLPEDDTVLDERREKEEFRKVNRIRIDNKQRPFRIDKGYRYLLVVCDLATGKTDAEPFKYKHGFIVRDCLKRIYDRRIIKKPKLLEVDAGKEFLGDFNDYWETKLTIRVKEIGRHRHQAVVESKNAIFGRIFNHRMIAEEIINKEQSKQWVSELRNVIRSVNTHLTHAIPEDDEHNLPLVRCKGDACNILEEGTRCRYQLDYPIDAVDDKKLYGKFRKGDIRWSKEILPITRIFLNPNQPPMYQLRDRTNVAYTKNQLQVVKGVERKPPNSVLRKFIITRVLKKIRRRGEIFYKVRWSDNSETDEPRENLIKDVPALIERFERSLKDVVPIQILERFKQRNAIHYKVLNSDDTESILSRINLIKDDPALVEYYEKHNK